MFIWSSSWSFIIPGIICPLALKEHIFYFQQLYRLKVSNYHGDAGDSLARQNGAAFTTIDKDNDSSGSANCAVLFTVG